MIKRLLSLTLLLALVIMAAGLHPMPVTAAPRAAASNADLLPADTSLYIDFRSADLDSTIKFVSDIYQKVTGQSAPDLYATSLDQGLVQVLGPGASFKTDVQPWLGDHISVGIRFNDEQIQKLSSGDMRAMQQIPDIFAIVSVKDAAAADKFFQAVKTKAESSGNASSSMKTRTDTVSGEQVTIYDQAAGCTAPNCASIVQAKTYFAIGTTGSMNAMLESVKANKPGLGSDANFKKVTGALQPDNLVTVYVTSKVYAYIFAQSMSQRKLFSTGAATPDAAAEAQQAKGMQMAQNALKAVQGQAIAFKRDGKVLRFDFVQGIDVQAMAQAISAMGIPADQYQKMLALKMDGKLAKQIPAKSIAVVMSNGLPTIYHTLVGSLKGMQGMSNGMNMPNMPSAQDIQTNLDKIQAFLKLSFDLDLEADILSWMNGDFAAYLVYDQNSSLSKMGSSPFPFDFVLLLDSSDAAKTKTFLTKFNTGLEKTAQLKATSAGDNLFKITPKNGPEIAYGLVGNTFVLASSTGIDTAAAAIKGDGIIANDPIWKNAQASAVQPQTQFWFINLTQISAALKVFIPADQMQKPDTKQGLAALDLFESAALSSSPLQSNGLTSASFQLIMK